MSTELTVEIDETIAREDYAPPSESLEPLECSRNPLLRHGKKADGSRHLTNLGDN